MGQRMYCHHEFHPGGDQEADQWCRDYHRPVLPMGEPCALDSGSRLITESEDGTIAALYEPLT